jgi:hypothetical protein
MRVTFQHISDEVQTLAAKVERAADSVKKPSVRVCLRNSCVSLLCAVMSLVIFAINALVDMPPFDLNSLALVYYTNLKARHC